MKSVQPLPKPEKPRYHHGDLRAALLIAAEAELAERGVEAFSLRQVAKRAGVSHAAPAHHFGDTSGLLTALATCGFQDFLDTQSRFEAAAAPDPKAQITAAGIGYVSFARARPALFRLMFGSDRPNYTDPGLKAAGDAAYLHLVAQVTAAGGTRPQDVAAVWSAAHGLADLLIGGRMKMIGTLPEDVLQDVVRGIIERALPKPRQADQTARSSRVVR